MVAETEDDRRRKPGDRLPRPGHRPAGAAPAASRTTSPSSPCSPTTAASPRCWRACRTPTARRRRAPSCSRPAASGASGCVYALTLADTGAFIGCAGLDARSHGLELGYWIGEPYWRHGYATEAAHALVDLAFRATAIEALNVSCRVINAASRRVIHKCGFQYAGQGMMNSISPAQVPIERYRLDRKTWVSLRSWGPS